MKKKNNEGFSLVELIIVIAIMAVLVIVLAPTFLKFVEKGRETTDMDNVTMAKEAIQVYLVDHGKDGEYKVQFDSAKKKIQVVAGTGSTLATDALKEYGIADTNSVAELTSEAWDSVLVMTYKKGTWTGNDNTVKATYYYANGKDIDSTTTTPAAGGEG